MYVIIYVYTCILNIISLTENDYIYADNIRITVLILNVDFDFSMFYCIYL